MFITSAWLSALCFFVLGAGEFVERALRDAFGILGSALGMAYVYLLELPAASTAFHVVDPRWRDYKKIVLLQP